MPAFRPLAAVVALTTVLSPTAAAAAASYDRLMVFGDSLSDTGNVFNATQGFAPSSPPYFQGRFSDGPVWVEQFAQAFGIELTPVTALGTNPPAQVSVNFAFGSAQTGVGNRVPTSVVQPPPAPPPEVPGLLGQVGSYTQSSLVDPDALHIVWSGANDYLLPFLEPVVFGSLFQTYLEPDSQTTVGNIAASINALIGEGVTDILVPNLPDLGAIPLAARLSDLLDGLLTPDQFDLLLAGFTTPAEALTALTDAHNAALEDALAQIAAANPTANLIPLDVHEVFEEVFAMPSDFGLTDVDNGIVEFCLLDAEVDPAMDNCALPGVLPTGFAFYDEQHPSTQMHGIIADAALEAVGVPEPATVLILAAGLGCLIAGGYQRRLAVRA